MPPTSAPAPTTASPTATPRVVLHVFSTTTVFGAITAVTVSSRSGDGVTTTRGGGAGGGEIGDASTTGSSVGTTTQRLPPLPTETSFFHGFTFGASATIVCSPGSTTIAVPYTAGSIVSPSRLITRPSTLLFGPT